jgi:hypothetical protein
MLSFIYWQPIIGSGVTHLQPWSPAVKSSKSKRRHWLGGYSLKVEVLRPWETVASLKRHSLLHPGNSWPSLSIFLSLSLSLSLCGGWGEEMLVMSFPSKWKGEEIHCLFANIFFLRLDNYRHMQKLKQHSLVPPIAKLDPSDTSLYLFSS